MGMTYSCNTFNNDRLTVICINILYFLCTCWITNLLVIINVNTFLLLICFRQLTFIIITISGHCSCSVVGCSVVGCTWTDYEYLQVLTS